MNGSGCKTCPVQNCDTLHYRGSRCAALRAKHGLGDPMTFADHIRAMTDEELAKFIFSMVDCVSCENKLMNNNQLIFGSQRKECNEADFHAMCNGDGRKCESVCLEWLQQPMEKNKTSRAPTATPLTPSFHGKDCLGNGNWPGHAYRCNGCQHYLTCFPDSNNSNN